MLKDGREHPRILGRPSPGPDLTTPLGLSSVSADEAATVRPKRRAVAARRRRVRGEPLPLLTTITSDGPQRRKAIAVWSAAGAAAGASGFVAGGVVTDVVGWRAVFWAYVPLAMALALVIGRTVPPGRAADQTIRLSLASSTLFTAAVMAFVVATTLLPER
jgi:hypothetical protein